MRTFHNVTVGIAAMCVIACDVVGQEDDNKDPVRDRGGGQESSCWAPRQVEEDAPGCWIADHTLTGAPWDRCCCPDPNDVPGPEWVCSGVGDSYPFQCTGQTARAECESGTGYGTGCCQGGSWERIIPEGGGGDTGGGGGGGGGGTYCDNGTTACNYVCCERGQYNCCGSRGANCCPSGFPYTDGDSCWPSYEAYCDTICAGTDPNGPPCNCLPLQECNLVR